jgi:ATP-binding cassette subfamily B protein
MMPAVSTRLLEASWPATELGAAISALVRRSGLLAEPVALAGPASATEEDIQAFMQDAGTRLGVEIVSVTSTCGELPELLRRLGPSLLRLPDASGAGGKSARFLLVLRGGSFGLSVLTPEKKVQKLDLDLVRQALLADRLLAEESSVNALFGDLELLTEVSDAGLRTFALERLRDVSVLAGWLVRSPPAGSARVLARTTHVPLLLALILSTRALSTVLSILLWWLVGRDVYDGELDRSALLSFALCSLSIIPLRILDGWAQARLALDVSATLKASLLNGVLHLDRTATRGLGIGQFLSMAMEGEQSSTAMDSALAVLVSLVELLAALAVLAAGVGGAVHVLLLLGWAGFIIWLCKSYYLKAQRWILASRKVTHDLVERLVGYQTRLVQERPEERNREEDALLCEYLGASRELDRRSLLIDSLLSHGWLILGMAALMPALASDTGIGPKMAASIGGVLMSAGSLKRFAGGVKDLIGVWISWQQTVPILQAGRQALLRDQSTINAEPAARMPGELSAAPLVRFDNLSLRYGPDAPAALVDCSQEIQAGDRILLEGPSGGGKSTLAMVLSGLRTANLGTVLLRGERAEQMPLSRWRSRVVLVPQFHDNHILTESLLFNLLLGRRWPATPEDERAAAAVCGMLGLGPLLCTMPQGLAQTVGDGGWALSHGERSRVFLARALLQEKVKLLILDESFAALDPETLRQACHGVLASAPTLLVIAHP